MGLEEKPRINLWKICTLPGPVRRSRSRLRARRSRLAVFQFYYLEASKGGMKVGRIKDPSDQDSFFGNSPPTFLPPLEPLNYADDDCYHCYLLLPTATTTPTTTTSHPPTHYLL